MRHLFVITFITLSLFVMLWFGVVVAGLSGVETAVVSALTVILIGFGLALTTGTFRRRRRED